MSSLHKTLMFVMFLQIMSWNRLGAAFYTEEYSWRDYDNQIPYDAFVAGRDHNSENLYFGQTIHEDKLIPGKIVPSAKKLFFEYFSKEYAVDVNIKILCTPNPQRFQWVPTNSRNILRIKDRILIHGGYEPTVFTFLGRVNNDGVSEIGKIICLLDSCYGLYFSNNGTTRLIRKGFEILTYNDSLKDLVVSVVVSRQEQSARPVIVNIYK
ncbi:hypothetical protein FQA39_LY08349 [Lamprigera yunnana]|nr:hypothetical protein FQA39_LY08349 [Lamprigera yunnana]